MKALAIFTLFLIAFGCMAQNHEFFQKMRKTDFGRTLLETIQLELKSNGNAVEQIVSLLKKMKEDIMNESKNLEEENERAKIKCTQDLSEIDSKLVEYNIRKEKNIENIKIAQKEIDELNPKIAEDSELLPNKEATLDRVEKAREIQRSEYEAAMDKISKYRQALKTAKTKFQVLQASGSPSSFLEVKEAVSSLESGKYLGFVKIITNLMQNEQIISDQGKVSRVLGLIDQLLQSLANDENTLIVEEGRNFNTYTETRNGLKNEISAITTRLNNNKDRVRELNNEINRLKLENTDIDNNFNLKKQERDALQKQCDDREAQYIKGRDLRNEQISTIDQALAIFQDARFTNSSIDALKKEVV